MHATSSPAWTTRLRDVFGAPLADIRLAHIESLVSANVSEDADLDFKAMLYGKTPDNKRELCKDIAAMRNDRGGVIVLGVADKDAVAVACPEVSLSDGEERRMRQIVATGTAPHAAFEIRAVKGKTRGKGFYLLIAEPSPFRPHAVLVDDGLRYPRRDGSGTRYLSEIEVADLYRDRFRGEREQIDRLSDIASDVLNTVKPATADRPGGRPWLVASLVPNSQGSLTISAAGRGELETWAQAEHLSHDPIEGFFETPPAAGVGVARYAVATALDPGDAPPHTYYLEAHTDGATAAARVFKPVPLGYPPIQPEDGTTTIFDSQLVRNALVALRVIGRNAVHNAGTFGDATVEVRLSGSAMYIANHGNGFPTRYRNGRRVDLAISRHTIPLDSLAGDPREFLVAARMMLADLFHAFGLAEVPHITLEGALRLRHFRDPDLDRWTLKQGIETTDELLPV